MNARSAGSFNWIFNRGFMVQRVAIYTRVSTSDQSCERQVAELTAYAAQGKYDVVAVFKETGSGAKNDRSERKRVLELARKGEIDLVLVSELSRWGRSTLDLRTTIQELADRKVALRALNGPDFDISTAQGKLMLNMLAAISEFERDLLSERIKSGIAHARSTGTKSGQAIGRPGFDRVERVNRLLADGRSIRSIARELEISKTTVMKVKAHITAPNLCISPLK
ncbi:MAG: recombinase family protein [Terriglobales bacterium]